MSLNYEMARYTELTGEDGTKVPIIKLGSFLDGYEKGRADAEEEVENRFNRVLDDEKRISYQQGVDEYVELFYKNALIDETPTWTAYARKIAEQVKKQLKENKEWE